MQVSDQVPPTRGDRKKQTALWRGWCHLKNLNQVLLLTAYRRYGTDSTYLREHRSFAGSKIQLPDLYNDV